MDDRDGMTDQQWNGGADGVRTVAISDDQRAARRAIEELNLDRARECGATTYQWPFPAQAVRRYRDFLWVCWHRREGGEPLAAISLMADQVWHCHMQDWDQYVRDCETIFGSRRVLQHKGPIADGDETYAHEEVLRLYDEYHVPRPALDDRRAKCVWAVVSPP